MLAQGSETIADLGQCRDEEPADASPNGADKTLPCGAALTRERRKPEETVIEVEYDERGYEQQHRDRARKPPVE